MQIVVNGLMTRYQRQGSGKTLLLLHGWGDKSETFNSLLPQISKKYEVIVLDLPGFGQTQVPKSAWNLDDYAKFLQEFLKKLEIKSIYSIIGHSNGGALAIRSLAMKRLEADKLVLLASAGVRDTQKVRRAGLKVIAKTGKVATFWLPKSSKQKLQKKLYGTVGSDMLDSPELQETFKKTVRQDIQRDAMKITIPTLLIYGDQDKATPLEAVGKQLNMRINGSYLKVIPGADHFVHQVAIAKELGLSDKQITAGMLATQPFEHRMQPRHLHGAWIIDDSYNGNIEGMRAGLTLLKALPGKRKIYVTPGLVDQGAETETVHHELGALIAAADPNQVVLMQNSVTEFILQGLEKSGFNGELKLEDNPLDYYTNLEHFLAAGDVVMLQNDLPDSYK